MLRPALVGLCLLLLAPPARAVQPQFWILDEASHFLEGDLDGLSVDAFGRVRLAPSAPVLHNPSYPYVWTLARDAKGAVYAGTGNDGKVFRIVGDTASVFFDAPELEVHALACGRDGNLYVATSPEGRVYSVKPDGKADTFFDPAEQYIWALAFDDEGKLLVATGGEGKVYRVGADGKAETLLDGPESHITSLAVAAGQVYAGSSPSGVIYRLDPALKKVVVLQDTLYREIRAIAVGSDGSVYAAAVEGSDKEDTTRPTAPAGTPAPAAPVTAEVTVTESFMGLLTPPPPATASGARTVESPRTGQTKGALLKLLPSGESDTLWSSIDEMPYALLRVDNGVLLGTGNKGKLYRIGDDRTWTMITALPVQQLTTLIAVEGTFVVGSSNPGTLYRLGGAPRATGTFLSKVRDTETVSTWGRVQWQAETPAGTQVRFETRSGHTSTPDKTWSDWSPASGEGTATAHERARFLQVRAHFEGKDGATPVLQSIRAPYLQQNLRPQVTSVTVHAPGEVFQKPLSVSGDTEILGLDPALNPPVTTAAAATPTPSMPITMYSRKLYQKGLQTFSWKGEDPNGDALTYDVEYRPVRDTRFRPLRKTLTESVLAWDTSTVPNGRYVVRIVARDNADNPDTVALAGDKESAPFDVDNSPPAVRIEVLGSGRLRASARDDSSLIRKAEYSVDGSRWQEIYPQDGINDSREETFELSLPGLGTGPHVVVLRATDLLGNVATAQATIE